MPGERGGVRLLAGGLLARVRRFGWEEALVLTGALGLLSRLLVVDKTLGSNDMVTWNGFAQQISQLGLGAVYDTNWYFNHPPLIGLAAGKLYAFSMWSGIRFEVLFKLPMVLADALSAWLVFRSWRQRSRFVASAAFALFAWNPVSIFVTGYHGNTDSLCASLSLLAAMLLDAKLVFLAGLALAASLNVKLIPIVLVPALLSCTRTPRDAVRFLLGLSLGVIPYIFVAVGHWAGFRDHVLGWRSYPGEWGLTGLFLEIGKNPHFAALTARVSGFWIERGAIIVLLFPTLLGLVNRFTSHRFSAREMGACTYAAFLMLAPGWGIQYSVYPVGLLFAANLSRAVPYGIVAGLYVVVVYVSLWTGTLPYYSDFYSGQPLGGKLLGYLAWLVSVRTVFDLVRRKSEPPPLRVPSTALESSERAESPARTVETTGV